eukprot:m.86440 g.86440  ORF g.86440 m.86440 type:complete len:390 (+) comp9666_c0_seq2:333-1502(+)
MATAGGGDGADKSRQLERNNVVAADLGSLVEQWENGSSGYFPTKEGRPDAHRGPLGQFSWYDDDEDGVKDQPPEVESQAVVEVPFDHLAHVSHIGAYHYPQGGDDGMQKIPGVEGIVEKDDKDATRARIVLRPSIHTKLYGINLFWLAPVPHETPSFAEGSPAFSSSTSRYGSVKFTFPMKSVMKQYAKARGRSVKKLCWKPLASMRYAQEICHTVLVCVKGDKLSKLQDRHADNGRPAVFDVSDKWQEARWTVYDPSLWSENSWEQLDVALFFPDNMVDPKLVFHIGPTADKSTVNVDFVNHQYPQKCTKDCFKCLRLHPTEDTTLKKGTKFPPTWQKLKKDKDLCSVMVLFYKKLIKKGMSEDDVEEIMGNILGSNAAPAGAGAGAD